MVHLINYMKNNLSMEYDCQAVENKFLFNPLLMIKSSKIVVDTSYQRFFLQSAFVTDGTEVSAGETPWNKVSPSGMPSEISITDRNSIGNFSYLQERLDIRFSDGNNQLLTECRLFFLSVNGYIS